MLVGVAGALVRHRDGDGAEVVGRERRLVMGDERALARGVVVTAQAHDDAARGRLGQRVSAFDHAATDLLVVARQVDLDDARTDQAVEQVCVFALGGERRAVEPAVDDQSEAGALALDQRVGALRRRILDRRSLGEEPLHVLRPIDLGRDLAQAVEEALRKIEGGGQRLRRPRAAFVEHANVGQGAAIVYADAFLHITLHKSERSKFR